MDAAKNKVKLMAVGDGELGLGFLWCKVVFGWWIGGSRLGYCCDWHGFDRGG